MTLGSFWSGRQYHLDRMSLGDLVAVFYQYPAVVTYHLLLAAAVAGSLWLERPGLGTALWAGIGWANFTLTWYLLHRFLLQGSLLYRFRLTAALWKRVHYDHHRDPNDLRVLFGALSTTLPPMLGFAGVVWALDGNPAHALAFLAASLAMTVWSEFCHCIQHLPIDPRVPYLRRLQKLHRIHHFRNENAYYGITNFFWDRLFRTHPADPAAVPKSDTVFNLGYDPRAQERYPWVNELSGPAAAELALGPGTPSR